MARLWRADPWGPVLALVAAAVFLLRGFEGALLPDVALYAYAGQQLADGVPPYVAVLNRAGPYAHALPGLGALIGQLLGVDELLAMRVVMMVVSAGCVWLAYLVGRDVFASRAAGLVGAATLFSFQGFITFATGGPREKTTMVLFVLAALWALSRGRWLLSGGAVALATLTWQPAFFPATAAVLAAVALLPTRGAQLRALVRYSIGGLVVVGVTLVPLWAAGSLPEFYEGFLGVHLGYTTQAGLLERPAGAAWGDVRAGYGWSAYLLALGTAAAVVLALEQLRGRHRRDRRQGTTVALGAGTMGCVGWFCVSFQGWPDAMVILPFAAVAVGGLAHRLASVLSERWTLRSAVVVALVIVLAAAGWSWSTRPEELPAQRAVTRDVLHAAGPDATIQGIATLQAHVLSGRRNPSRYVNFGGGLYRYVDDQLPGGLEGFAQDLERRRPTLIVTGGTSLPRFKWLRPVLSRHYTYLGGEAQHGQWFASDAVGTARIEQLRDALEAHDVPTGTRP